MLSRTVRRGLPILIFFASLWFGPRAGASFPKSSFPRDYAWSGSSWVKTNETRLLYDGLLPVQERDANNAVLVTYTRGLDLSGSLHGAGGIGGLLARTDGNGSVFYHADGVGNITALMDEQGDIVARYLYNPFGKLVGRWGTLAEVNIMRFSAVPYHWSGLSLYPSRVYDGQLQRWLTPEPLGEYGSLNLYRFVRNDPLSNVDPDGEKDHNVVHQASSTLPTAPRDYGQLTLLDFNNLPSIDLDAVRRNAPSAQQGNGTIGAKEEYHRQRNLLPGAPHLVGTPMGQRLAEMNSEMYGSILPFPMLSKIPCPPVTKDLSKLTRGELSKLISPEQRKLIHDLFGHGPDGARKALESLRAGGKLPDGLSREALELYAEIARKSIAEGIDKIGTQAEKLKLLEEALK